MTTPARSHGQQSSLQHQHHHRQGQRHQRRHHLSCNTLLQGLPLLLTFLLLTLLLTVSAPGAEARHVSEDSDHLLHPHSAHGQVKQSGARQVSRTLTFLRRTLRSLGDAMRFFHRQHAHVNLDGVIGTRIVEGTLKVLLANTRRRGQMALLPVDIARDLWSVHQLATVVSDESEPYVAINEEEYFNRIWPTVHQGTWELDYAWRNLSSSVPTWPFSEQEAMEEEESDDCLTELFGTTGKTKNTCVISDQCWGKMTKMGYHMYSLSHQIFYLQLGERSGCLPEILQRIQNNSQPSLRELQDTFCANMLRESRHLAQQGYPAIFRDLFMEQAGLCGMYGYWQFFRYSWLDRMLSWQDREKGCYLNDDWPRYVDEHRGRVKREEIRLDNGCLSHMTAVASAGLSQYVRFLTEAFLLTTDHRYHQHIPH